MAQKTKVTRETVTSSPTLKEILKEVTQWSEEALSLMRRLPKLSLSAQQELEPELYVALAVLREKISSALREWERVMDEELPDD